MRRVPGGAGGPVMFNQNDTIRIGSFEEYGDGVIVDDALQGFVGTFETIWVVPESGTALLIGLGLAGLAARRR